MNTFPRVTEQYVHVTLMHVLNKSSSSALDLQYDDTMETRSMLRKGQKPPHDDFWTGGKSL